MSKPITTPKGKAIFPHLTEADYKFKSEGEYHVKLECLKSESENIIQTVALYFTLNFSLGPVGFPGVLLVLLNFTWPHFK